MTVKSDVEDRLDVNVSLGLVNGRDGYVEVNDLMPESEPVGEKSGGEVKLVKLRLDSDNAWDADGLGKLRPLSLPLLEPDTMELNSMAVEEAAEDASLDCVDTIDPDMEEIGEIEDSKKLPELMLEIEGASEGEVSWTDELGRIDRSLILEAVVDIELGTFEVLETPSLGVFDADDTINSMLEERLDNDKSNDIVAVSDDGVLDVLIIAPLTLEVEELD